MRKFRKKARETADSVFWCCDQRLLNQQDLARLHHFGSKTGDQPQHDPQRFDLADIKVLVGGYTGGPEPHQEETVLIPDGAY